MRFLRVVVVMTDRNDLSLLFYLGRRYLFPLAKLFPPSILSPSHFVRSSSLFLLADNSAMLSSPQCSLLGYVSGA